MPILAQRHQQERHQRHWTVRQRHDAWHRPRKAVQQGQDAASTGPQSLFFALDGGRQFQRRTLISEGAQMASRRYDCLSLRVCIMSMMDLCITQEIRVGDEGQLVVDLDADLEPIWNRLGCRAW